MEENRPCYRFQKRTYDDGLFRDAVDATYIIHLKGNGRNPTVEEQLSRHRPSNIVYIIENQGYKKCPKTLHQYKPPYDLTDAFLQAFRHAARHSYKHILVLEDDYIFEKTPDTHIACGEISDFLKKRGTEKFIYYLGCIPYIQSTGFSLHNQLYLSTGTHACIYSKQLRDHILNDHRQSDIIDWDYFHNMNLWHYPRYVYHKPLCYQIYPPTENSKHWYNPMGISDIIKFTHSAAGVDKRVEPGHTTFYFWSKIAYLLIWVLILYATIAILRQFVGLGKMTRKMPKKGR